MKREQRTKTIRLPVEIIYAVQAEATKESRSFTNKLCLILEEWAREHKKTA